MKKQFSQIEQHLNNIEPVSKMIEKGLTPEKILEVVLGENNVQILDKTPVQFKCQCSKERFGAAIISLGVQEIQEMIDEDGGAEAQCHFCLENTTTINKSLKVLSMKSNNNNVNKPTNQIPLLKDV